MEIGKLVLVDVTTKEMFQSPYYQLQQNDVVFVEPTIFKLRQRDQQIITQQISFALTLVTTAALLFNIFR